MVFTYFVHYKNVHLYIRSHEYLLFPIFSQQNLEISNFDFHHLTQKNCKCIIPNLLLSLSNIEGGTYVFKLLNSLIVVGCMFPNECNDICQSGHFSILLLPQK